MESGSQTSQLSLWVVSLANLTATQDSEKGTTMTVRSGLKCLELSGRLRRHGLLAKTLLASSQWTAGAYLTALSLTWKMQAIRSKHLLFRLVPSALPTEGTGFGLLPAATVNGNNNRKGLSETSGDGLQTAIKNALLPTPISSDGSGGRTTKGKNRQGEAGLATAIALLPTPTAQDCKNSTLPPSQVDRDSVPGALIRNGMNTGYRLQPAFVEWMMGFPEGWTEVNG